MNRNLPLCVFCHPKLALSCVVDAEWDLPVCSACNAIANKKPTLPSFQWDAVRQQIRLATGMELA